MKCLFTVHYFISFQVVNILSRALRFTCFYYLNRFFLFWLWGICLSVWFPVILLVSPCFLIFLQIFFVNLAVCIHLADSFQTRASALDFLSMLMTLSIPSTARFIHIILFFHLGPFPLGSPSSFSVSRAFHINFC